MRDPVAATRACPACGAAHAAHATFCLECGAPLDAVPTPQSALRTPHSMLGRREVALGLALVLLVLGYAVWDWRHAEDQAQAYDAGVRAAAAQDWDAAAVALAPLGNYYDAPQRLATARDAIRRRDTAFSAGQAAAARQDWLGAYRAYSDTLAIQATYRDTPALFAVARDRAVAAALTATVYLQTTGPVPGLYRRDPASGTPIHLLESDGHSVVRRYNAAQQWVIYDGLAPGVLTGPLQTGQPAPTDRRLWLAGLAATDPSPVVLPEAVDLAQDIMLPVRGGVWLYRTGLSPVEWQDLADLSTGGHLRSGTWLARLRYFDAASGTLADRLPLGPAALLDGDGLTGRLLLGVPDLADPTGRHTQLLLLAPGQATAPVVADVPGLLDWAALRPGASALAYAAGLGARGPLTARAYSGASDVTGPITALELGWIDLQAPMPTPHGLTSITLAGYEPLTSLRGAWVPGPGPRRLLVRRIAGPDVTLSLLAPDRGDERLLWQTPLASLAISRTPNNARVFLAPAGLGAFLLAPPPTIQDPDRLLWLSFDPGAPPVHFAPFPPGSGPLVEVAPAPDGDGLVVVLAAVDINATGGIYRFSRAHPQQAPTLLYSWPPNPTSLNWPQLLPGGVLGWIDETGLHLRPFDGQGDLPTQPGITQLQIAARPYGEWLQP